MIVELDWSVSSLVVWSDADDAALNSFGTTWKLTNLDNWYSSPPVRTTISSIPNGDGGFNPVRSYRDSKVMAIEGVVTAVDSFTAIQQAWGVLAAIAPQGEMMNLTVDDDFSVQSMNVWLNGAPQVLPFTATKAKFQIPIIATDPRKYGSAISGTAIPSGTGFDGLHFPLFAAGFLDFGTFRPSGLFYIQNTGTAESWPTFAVQGGIDSSGFTIQSDSQVIEYDAAVASGASVLLSPYAGGRASSNGVDVSYNMSKSQWPSILPGQRRTFSFGTIGSADINALVTWNFRSANW